MSQAGLKLVIDTDDGGVIISARPLHGEQDQSTKGWFDNLAGDERYSGITEDLLQGIQFDVQGQKDHLETVAKLITLLGYKIEPPRAGDSGVSDAPLEGMSNARSSLLSEACVRFWANSVGEFLPAAGPVKVREDWDETNTEDAAAELLERAANHYLTVTATEYYPDTSRMLFNVGGMGCQFKKVYHCPLRKRPVSEAVSIEDMIVDVTATDLENAARVTHKVMMRHARVRKLQKMGFYREVALTQPVEQPDAVTTAIAGMQGRPAAPQYQNDHRHTIYECYCYLDLDDDGNELPYVVTMDRDSRQMLAIRRDWDEDDQLQKRRKTFVKFPYIEALGFYCIGLMHILGNDTNQLTAMLREYIDAGMFASFPAFLYSKDFLTEQNTSLFRLSPGTGQGIETGGQPIGNVIANPPYREPSAALANIMDKITLRAERVGGTAEVKVAEGRQDAPVGTTLAMMEQAQKPVAAVHKGIHYAFGQEFQILRDRFREDPDALLQVAAEIDDQIGEEHLRAALNDLTLIPASDPNTPSQMQRILKNVGLIQLNQSFPGVMSAREIVDRCLRALGIDSNGLIQPPAPPMMPPAMQPPGASPAELALKSKQVDAESQAAERGDLIKAQQATQENQTRLQVAQIGAASREKVAAAQLAQKEQSDQRSAAIDALGTNQPPPQETGE